MISARRIVSTEDMKAAMKRLQQSNNGLVFITDRGLPAHVLMSIEDYQRITGNHKKIADLLAMPEIADVDLTIPRSSELARLRLSPLERLKGSVTHFDKPTDPAADWEE